MFTNVCERYGEQEPVTIGDYRQLNPDGVFQIAQRESGLVIVEEVDGECEIVAEEIR